MLCPVCKVDLTLSERQGVEIDYCPKCRGVWLDRSELDKIIERAHASDSSNDEEDSPRGDRRDQRRRRDQEDEDDEGGFLGNLFGGFGGRDD